MSLPNVDPFERRLAPQLFDRRFDELVELGRAQLPKLAPQWTDHNWHDPGITLIDLLAWVAEAQLYSLARMRRDERAAYAALLGISPNGPRPARGLIWPAPGTGAAGVRQSFVIERDARAHSADAETPKFRTEFRVLWVAGAIRALRTRLSSGARRDHTRVNQRGAPAFLPFGESAGPRDVLALEFECASDRGLFPPRRAEAEGASLVIGVRADAGADHEEAGLRAGCAVPLEVTLVADSNRFALPVIADTTERFLRTGVLVLDLSGVQGSPTRFTLEIRAPRGFERAPRVLAIEPNVLPIVQGERIERELHVSNGLPDQAFELGRPGLRFGEDATDVTIEVNDPAPFTVWPACDRLAERAPGERVVQIDAANGRILFGNGVNGAVPPQGAQIFLSYDVCDGEQGNVARRKPWVVHGVSGVFGTNRDPVAGGRDATDLLDDRRIARRRAREERPLVTAADLVTAAHELPGLEVARAWLSPPRGHPLEHATLTLVVMGARAGGIEREQAPETRRWLEAIRRRLAPRVPLGTRLAVVAPAYVGFRFEAQLVAEASLDPAEVEREAWRALDRRLALVPAPGALAPREFGIAVTSRDLAAWLLQVPGVQRVTDVRVVVERGKPSESDWVPARGLPRLDRSRSRVRVERAAPGGTV